MDKCKQQKTIRFDVPFSVSDSEFLQVKELVQLACAAERYRITEECPGFKTFWFRIKTLDACCDEI